MWNTCLRSGGGVILGGGLVIFFLSINGSKIRLIEGYISGNLVGIEGGDTRVAVLVQ